MNPTEIARTIESTPGRWGTEDDLQQHLGEVLAGAGFEREVSLSARDRLDLWNADSGIAVEVKVDGSAAAVLRQILRYADRPEVRGIVLATTRPGCASHMPESLCGKPVAVARLWLWGLR